MVWKCFVFGANCTCHGSGKGRGRGGAFLTRGLLEGSGHMVAARTATACGGGGRNAKSDDRNIKRKRNE